jgi:hypothetical protein
MTHGPSPWLNPALGPEEATTTTLWGENSIAESAGTITSA